MCAFDRSPEFGILGLPMPQRYGGTAEDIATVVLAMEALGYACKDNGLTFGLGAQMWSVQMPLLIFGSDALKDQFLPRPSRMSLAAVLVLDADRAAGFDQDLRGERRHLCGDGFSPTR